MYIRMLQYGKMALPRTGVKLIGQSQDRSYIEPIVVLFLSMYTMLCCSAHKFRLLAILNIIFM